MKASAGILLAFAVGLGCRFFGIPSPAPPAIAGALLVFAMTVGYALTDRFMATTSVHAHNSAGPHGKTAREISSFQKESR